LLGAKVALVLGVLLLANLAVGLGGLHAVAVTNRQADLLYGQSLQQVRDLTGLGDALDQTYQHALRLIPTNAAPKLVEIGGQLDQESIPAVQRALEVVEREQADHPPAVRALVQRVRDGWQRFLKLRRSGRFELTSATPGLARLNDALTEETARVFATMQTAVDQLTDQELQRAQRADDFANSTYRSSRLLIVVILVGSLAAAIAVGIWLTRDIVRRIRDYAAFASKVTDGAGTRPLRPRGSDELAGLGHSLNQMLARRQASRITQETQAEFIEMLQVTVGEEEAQDLVKRHLERSVGDSSVVVLNRNNSADRLEPVTALVLDSPVWPPWTAPLRGPVWRCVLRAPTTKIPPGPHWCRARSAR
jgi:methyl-accepting chemotaxis protein